MLEKNSIADGDSMLVGLRVARGQDAASIADWFESAAILTEGSLESVRQARSKGAARRRIDQGEQLWLTPPPDMIVYSIALDPRFLRIDETLEIIGAVGARS